MTTPRLLLSGRIEYGHLIQFAGILILGIGLYFGMNTRIDEANRVANAALARANEINATTNARVDKIEATLDARAAKLEASMQLGFERLSKQVESIPLIADRMANADQRWREFGARVDAIGSKLGDTDRTAYDAYQTAKRLEAQVDRINGELSKPVPVRPSR